MVKIYKLDFKEHNVWMKVIKEYAFNAEYTADIKDPPTKQTTLCHSLKNVYFWNRFQNRSTYLSPILPKANDGKGVYW